MLNFAAGVVAGVALLHVARLIYTLTPSGVLMLLGGWMERTGHRIMTRAQAAHWEGGDDAA